MLLVLSGLDDVPALWFAREAQRRGVACTIVTSEVLSFARRRSHRVGMNGVHSVVELPDGTVLDDESLHGVLNRLPAPPDLAWRRAMTTERHYASAELHAFVLSWLASLRCPVRNRPSDECLAGPSPHPMVAAHAASQAGLLVAPIELGTATSVSVHSVLIASARRAAGPGARIVQLVCLDGVAVHDDVPAELRPCLARFVRAVGAQESLVGIDMVVRGDAWWFAGITPLPELRLGGAALVERLTSTLQVDLVGAR